MIKQLHYFKSWLLLMLCMVVGVSSAWAQDSEEIASGTFNGKNATYTEGWSTTGTGQGRIDCIIIGSGENITSPTFDLSQYSEVTISIKARRFGTLSGSKATIAASIGGTTVGTTDATGTNATASLTDIVFEPTSAMTSSAIVFTCTNATSAGSTHGAGINSIVITGVPASDPSDTRADAELSFSSATASATIGQDFTAPTLSAATGFNGTVDYESSNEDVAQIYDQETGELRIVGEGTTTITATFAGNDDFKAGSASYTLTVTDNRIATTISYDNITLDVTEVATLTQLSPVVKDADNNVIAYTYEEFPPTVSFTIESDDNGIIGSLDNNSGEITLNATEGTATLKAYYNLYGVSDTYKPSQCTFTITVEDMNAPGKVNNPYTVADAIAAIENNTGITDVYVTGIVCTAGSSLSSGSLTYWISEDGTEDTRLQIYKGKSINGANFESTDDIQVGDEVVVHGNLTLYNSDTYEFTAGSNLVSRVRPLTADLTFAEESYSVNLGDALTITASSTNSDGAITYESSNTAVAEIDATTGAVTPVSAGTTTITATIAATQDVKGTSITTKLTVIDPNAKVAKFEKVTDASTLKVGDKLIIVYETGSVALSNEWNTENRNIKETSIVIDDTDNTIELTDNVEVFTLGEEADSWTLQGATFGFIGNATSGTSNYILGGLDATDTNAQAEISITTDGDAVIKFAGGCSKQWLRYNTNSGNGLFACYGETNQKAVQLYREQKETETVEVTITAAGAASFSCDKALDFSQVTELTAYKATSKSDSYVHLDEVEQVPAGAGVIVKGAEGLYSVPVVTGDVAELEGNLLVGTGENTFTVTSAEYGKVFKYVKTNAGVVGFQKAKEGWTCQAGHAYLMLQTTSAREFIGIFDEDISTGIEAIDNSQLTIDNDAPAYNLAGQKVGKGYKGIVVKNGKKVVIK